MAYVEQDNFYIIPVVTTNKIRILCFEGFVNLEQYIKKLWASKTLGQKIVFAFWMGWYRIESCFWRIKWK